MTAVLWLADLYQMQFAKERGKHFDEWRSLLDTLGGNNYARDNLAMLFTSLDDGFIFALIPLLVGKFCLFVGLVAFIAYVLKHIISANFTPTPPQS